MVGVREINDDELTAQQRNWLNRHTVYTHGYGLVAAPANQVVCGGLPYFVSGFLGDDQRPAAPRQTEEIPVEPAADLLRRADAHRRLRDRRPVRPGQEAEFDRPQPATTTPRSTTPTAARAACRSARSSAGWSSRSRTHESNFLLSDAVNDDSRLMYVRDPRDAGGEGGAVPDHRRRPVPGRGRRPDRSGSSTATRRRRPTRTRSRSTCSRRPATS